MTLAVMTTTVTLPALVDRACAALASARTSAEVLEARDMASFAYDVAKKMARLHRAKRAHDELVAAAFRAQADALVIESEAKRRLADEYDAAQSEKAKKGGRPKTVPDENGFTAAEAGLSRKKIHDARQDRDAEEADPGIVRRTVDDALAAGKEPTKAKVRRAVAKSAKKGKHKPKVRYAKAPVSIDPEPRHDADLRRLDVAWEAACQSARSAFLQKIADYATAA